MNTIPKTILLACCALICGWLMADARDARLQELEDICAWMPDDDLETAVPDPTPEIVKSKYGLSNADIVNDLHEIAMRYGPGETNADFRSTRRSAIYWMGKYGSSNDVYRIADVVTNASDYAQDDAVTATMDMLRFSPELIPFVRNVATNSTVFSYFISGGMYVRLHAMGGLSDSGCYVEDAAQRARIAEFFLERAALAHSHTLYVDECTCSLNPWYRHSQQRRDNLAALRPPDLTGRRAELYDASQADAAQSD